MPFDPDCARFGPGGTSDSEGIRGALTARLAGGRTGRARLDPGRRRGNRVSRNNVARRNSRKSICHPGASGRLTHFAIFALLGLLLEVVFTWIAEGVAKSQWNHHGHTCPLMIFDYGLLGLVLMPMARPMIHGRVPLAARAFLYMIGIFLVEYASGWIFVLCYPRIWDYGNLPWN